jgi:hypothetical protein
MTSIGKSWMTSPTAVESPAFAGMTSKEAKPGAMNRALRRSVGNGSYRRHRGDSRAANRPIDVSETNIHQKQATATLSSTQNAKNQRA